MRYPGEVGAWRGGRVAMCLPRHRIRNLPDVLPRLLGAVNDSGPSRVVRPAAALGPLTGSILGTVIASRARAFRARPLMADLVAHLLSSAWCEQQRNADADGGSRQNSEREGMLIVMVVS